MRCTVPYLFICYLHNVMPLVEYVEKNKKKIKGSQKHPLINLLIYFFLPILSFTKYFLKIIKTTTRAKFKEQEKNRVAHKQKHH
jgi:hypothetical protein